MELKGNPQLVEAFRRGDREVLARMYRFYAPALDGYLMRGFTFESQGRTYRFHGFVEPFQRQEVLQEAFLRAFRDPARQSYDATRSYEPYLLTIARNLVIDWFRRKRLEDALFVPIDAARRDGESHEEALHRIATTDERRPTPESEALQRELKRTLMDFVQTLDPADVEVLRLHLLGELTQHQMADHLGETRNDVRKRIRLIRQRLLRHLKSKGLISTLSVGEVFRMVEFLIVFSRVVA